VVWFDQTGGRTFCSAACLFYLTFLYKLYILNLYILLFFGKKLKNLQKIYIFWINFLILKGFITGGV